MMLPVAPCSLGPWVVMAFMITSIGTANALYAKNSPVLQVDSKNYDSLIAQSNYTSIVEFYAPWCGHCQNLKKAYEKTALNLVGLAKVAAVNCDEESNKSLCGRMGVQGFPTLKIVKPGPKSGRPVVEDYHGLRSAKALVDAVVDKIPNHVRKLQDQDLEAWLSTDKDSAKAILFTTKGTTSALLRALAVDFLGSIKIAQIRNKEKMAVKTFGVSKFPSLVLLPGGEQEPQTYKGEMKKETMVAFLSQITAPNLDPAPKSSKTTSSKSLNDEDMPRASSSFSEASAAHRADEASEAAASGRSIVVEDFEAPESPRPIVPAGETPMAVPGVAPAIATLATPKELESACLGSATGTCVLALLPTGESPDATYSDLAEKALKSLAEVANKHVRRKANLFPFYAVPAENEAAKSLRGGLGLNSETILEIVAVNGKKGWWIHFDSKTIGLPSIESFIDAIKLGEGKKKSMPKEVISSGAEKDNRHAEL